MSAHQSRWSVACALVVGLTTGACTVLSGVDEMELRKTSNPASPATPANDAGDLAPLHPFGPDGGPPAVAPPNGSSGNPAPATGPATCGATGSWMECRPDDAITSCAVECAQKGFACVDDCCTTDAIGDFPAKVGMVYAYASECSLKTLPSNATFGSCVDPTIFSGSLGTVRCCCK